MVQAIIILSFHHSISCFCVANGIFQEQDFCFFSQTPKLKEPILINLSEEKNHLNNILEKEKSVKDPNVLNYLKNYSCDLEKEETKVRTPNNTCDVVKIKEKKRSKKKSLQPIESGLETALEISKIIFSFEFFEKFLINEKKEAKFFLEDFNWHQFKGMKSYVNPIILQ